MQITAAMVKELRERTGSGMMECKKALQEAGGDIDTAIENMRKSGLAKADKKAGRVAAEGRIAIKISDDGKTAAIVEVNCETDFVSGGDDFLDFVNAVAVAALENKPESVEALVSLTIDGGQSIEERRKEMVSRIGENIQVRRFEIMSADNAAFGSYLHGTRIGVLIGMENGKDELIKDVAMHIAASKPTCVTEDQVPPEVSCDPSVNPHGNRNPRAPGNGGQGQNQDGFYQLNAYDPTLLCEVTLEVFDGDGYVFAGILPGDVIKYTQDDSIPQEQKKMGSGRGQAGAVAWHLIGHGDLSFTATDTSGNTSAAAVCLVPPPPK
jgi:hypothetical protein